MITLINPRRKMRTRTKRRLRRIKRNPPKATVKRRKRTIRRRKARTVTRSVVRRARRTVRRIRRKARRVVASVRRRVRRGRRSGSSGKFGIKSVLNKENLMIAGGAVLGTYLSSTVLNAYGPTRNVNGVITARTGADGFVLPGSNSPAGYIAYSLLIPVAGAFIANKMKQRELAKGLVLSSIVMGLNSVLAYVQQRNQPAQVTAGTGEYFNQVQLPAPQNNGVQGIFDSDPAFNSAF